MPLGTVGLSLLAALVTMTQVKSSIESIIIAHLVGPDPSIPFLFNFGGVGVLSRLFFTVSIAALVLPRGLVRFLG